ncbi:MAG: biotin--[acetyl-CoA-carboxylase] ligase [Elusimicrobiota bacterium]
MKIIYFDEVNSTMDMAKKFERAGHPEWTIIAAKKQTKGRGRFGRRWVSPIGGLYFSVILKPRFVPNDTAKLTLIGAMSVTKVLNKLYGLPAKIKWPNDILVKNKKISGVLVESEMSQNKIKWAVLGIGINVNTDIKNLKNSKLACTSVKHEFKKEVSEKKLLKEILSEIKKNYLLINPAG